MMKQAYLVLHGSSYSDDRLVPEYICATEEQAKTFKDGKTFENLYHIKSLPFIDNSYQEELDYILERIKSSDGLDIPLVMRQIKSLWTAFCLHHDQSVDTHSYDMNMLTLWKYMCRNKSNPYSSVDYERFYNIMSGNLI